MGGACMWERARVYNYSRALRCLCRAPRCTVPCLNPLWHGYQQRKCSGANSNLELISSWKLIQRAPMAVGMLVAACGLRTPICSLNESCELILRP